MYCNSVADGIYTAIQMPVGDRHLRHEKHWRYISGHTVGYWAQVLLLLLPLPSYFHSCREAIFNTQHFICNTQYAICNVQYPKCKMQNATLHTR